VDESYLWPDALDRDQIVSASESEIIAVYPHRWAVPQDIWGHLFEQAEHEIGILVYAGLFMAADAGLRRLLASKAEAGVRVRILLGDPDSPCVAERGHAEGIDDAVPAKVHSAIAMFRPLGAVENVEIRPTRQHQRGGQRSPHKPLLVLLALGRLSATGSSALPWSSAEAALADLIAEFGPTSGTGRAQSAAYPFTRLRADGVWVLDRDVPADLVRPLAEGHVTGRFEASVESAAGRAVYDLHGRELSPRPGTAVPAVTYVSWHTRQVFKGEPLTA
jgi:hypothetical protein